MNLVVDTHTHTISSGHAYSTVQEMAKEAYANGIQAFAITDHGPNMGGAPHLYHFGNLWVIPQVLYGVRIIKGVEANIIDYQGTIDMPEKYLRRLEFTLAGFHDICLAPASVEAHTHALVKALENPYVDAISHPGNPQFQVDIEKVVEAAKRNNKAIEINNQSFVVRSGSEDNCMNFLKECIRQRVRVVCGSDAHISFDVGSLARVQKMLEHAGISEDLVINTSLEKIEAYLKERKERTDL